MAKKRRYFAPEEKVAILREHLVEKHSVSDVCRKHDISPNLFYIWQREFFEKGYRAFQPEKKDRRLAKLEAENARLREKIAKKHEVLSELMEEHVQLKKEIGEP